MEKRNVYFTMITYSRSRREIALGRAFPMRDVTPKQ